MKRPRSRTTSPAPWDASVDSAPRTFSRRDILLLGTSGILGLAAASMLHTANDLASPAVAAARPGRSTVREPEPVAPAPVDVTPPDLATRILTEVPLSTAVRDEIALEARRFAVFGAGSVVTLRKDWPIGAEPVSVTAGRIDLAASLMAGDAAARALRSIALPVAFARSAFVNLVPRRDNGGQLQALGAFLLTVEALRAADGTREALALLDPSFYLPTPPTDRDPDRLLDPEGLFAAAVTTLLRFPASLIAAIEAMPVRYAIPNNDPARASEIMLTASPAAVAARRYLAAVAALLTALIPNPDRRGAGYLDRELDGAFPGFTTARASLQWTTA